MSKDVNAENEANAVHAQALSALKPRA